MRIAVLSDIHGNLLALDAVIADIESQAPDEIWCGGDVAWGGPWPSECIARVREKGWPTVKGNTDIWVTGDPQTISSDQYRARLNELARSHDLSARDQEWLLNLPLGHSGPGSLLLVHASPESPFKAPEPDAPAADFSPYQGKAKVVIYGHVHQAFVRRLVEGTIVCNPGSVGMPKDAATASYLLLDLDGPDLVLRHRRVTFDRDAALDEARKIGPPLGDYFIDSLNSR